jgi:hypothetical protein
MYRVTLSSKQPTRDGTIMDNSSPYKPTTEGILPRSRPHSRSSSRSRSPTRALSSHGDILSSDFSVHVGPPHLSSPLGHSSSHDHYIKPVPPTYVTEYEAAFQPPPLSAYLTPSTYMTSEESLGSPLKHYTPSLVVSLRRIVDPRACSTRIGDKKSQSYKYMSFHASFQIPSGDTRDVAYVDMDHDERSWSIMEKTLTALGELGYDRTLVDGVVPQVSMQCI